MLQFAQLDNRPRLRSAGLVVGIDVLADLLPIRRTRRARRWKMSSAETRADGQRDADSVSECTGAKEPDPEMILNSCPALFSNFFASSSSSSMGLCKVIIIRPKDVKIFDRSEQFYIFVKKNIFERLINYKVN